MNQSDLFEYAKEQARASAIKRELRQVSVATGLDYSWLHKFSKGKIPKAGYHKVETLASYYVAVNSAPVAHEKSFKDLNS